MCGVAAAVLAMAAPAAAQRLARDSLFNRGSLEDLLQESKEQHKILVVFYVGARMSVSADRDVEKMRERTFRSPTVGLWLKWHGVLTEVNEAERPKQFAKIQGALRSTGGGRGGLMGENVDYGSPPRILIFKDGKLARVLPDPSQDGEKYRTSWRKNSENRFVSPAYLLLRLDMLMDGLGTTDPVWLAAHNHDNPPPERPPTRLLCRTDDANAPAIEDPPAPEGEPVDVLAVLEEARDARRARHLHDATGLFTWVWERGAALDPAFEAARVTLVAEEIGDLCRARKATMQRFREVFDEMSSIGLWLEWPERFAWMSLGARIGRSDDFIEVFDLLTEDIDEAPITPREERAISKELMRKNPAASPLALPKDGPGPLASALDGGALLKQAGAGGTWQALRDTRKWLAKIEATRAYAAYLKAGRDADGAVLEKALIESADDPSTRVSLVMTALAFGEARPEHLRLLDEAAARGVDRPTLRRRVTEALAAREPVVGAGGEPADAGASQGAATGKR